MTSVFNVLYHGSASDAADLLDGDHPPDNAVDLRAALTNALRKIAKLEADVVKAAEIACDQSAVAVTLDRDVSRIVDLGVELEKRIALTAAASSQVGDIFNARLNALELGLEQARGNLRTAAEDGGEAYARILELERRAGILPARDPEPDVGLEALAQHIAIFDPDHDTKEPT